MTAPHPVTVSVAVEQRARVGEGPVWHDGTLLWVDILAGAIHTWNPGTGERTTRTVATLVGAAAPSADGGLVLATAEGFAALHDTDNGGLDTRRAFLPDGVRMNDAKVDRRGRFWAGSCAMDFAAGRGALHVLHPDWSVELVLDGLTQPNGLDWSPDDSRFYLIDTARQVLTAWDFDRDAGRIAAPRDLVHYDGEDRPDGMTVDAGGDLWIAMWGGGRIEHRTASGELVDIVVVPVAQPSSCTFGGTGSRTLFVTSAAEGRPPDATPDGSLLAVHGLGTTGSPSSPFGG